MDAESIVVTATDQVIYYSEKIANLNLIKDERIQNKELSNLIRAVRRSGNLQDATMELPRGPIGAGTHNLLVRVTTIGDAGLIAILIIRSLYVLVCTRYNNRLESAFQLKMESWLNVLR